MSEKIVLSFFFFSIYNADVMNLSYSSVKDFQQKIRDWYWTYGRLREGSWSLSRGFWLDRVNRECGLLCEIFRSKENDSKPAIALWGPSQSGKSTLLASFIDYDFETTKGALSWGKDAFRFVLKDGKGEALNPNNRGSDASGCVTRYVMRDSVRFPEAPVEIEFATEREILTSLAFGYLSEMDGKNNSGERVFWDAEKITNILQDFRDKKQDNLLKPELFSRLEIVLDIVEAFFLTGESRYENLRSKWENIRGDILNCDTLIKSEEDFEGFVSKIFWDEKKKLTDSWKKLLKKQRELEKVFSGKKIYCSLDIASLFLDISAAENKETCNRIPEIVLDEDLGGESVALCYNNKSIWSLGKKGKSFFKDERDFAYTQALVLLLIVPLREQVISKANSALFNLLKESDIVDFPGVAKEEKGLDESKESDETLCENPLKVLTKVVKRGKTASIVIGYARNLNIDIFSLLLPMNEYPSKPDQLLAGIKAWYESMLGEKYSEKNARELPINIVQTFSAKIINSVVQKCLDENGLKEIFKKLEEMSLLGNPQCVDFFMINYPQFKDRGTIYAEGKELEEIVEAIENDKFFQDFYSETKKSLREMCGLGEYGKDDGGRTFLFRRMLKQVQLSKRFNRLHEKENKTIEELSRLVKEALPPEGDESSKRAELFQKVAENVKVRAQESCCEISRKICRALSIHVETMEKIPNCFCGGVKNKALQDYTERLYSQLRKNFRDCFDSEFGLIVEAERELFSKWFANRVEPRVLEAWINKNVPAGTANLDRVAMRRSLAIWIPKALLRSDSTNDKVISGFPRRVCEFLQALEILKGESESLRGNQPGDESLQNFYNELN